jgi:nitric oxide reductase NorE protein
MVAVVQRERPETRLPGDVGVWVFVLGDLVIFAAYLLIYMVYRNQQPQVFLAGQRHLDLDLAFVNTLILLASSRMVALAVQATRAGDHRRALRLIGWAMGSGGLFLGIKAYEWTTRIHDGYSISHDTFFLLWFTLTGVHALHVVVGLIFLGVVVRELRSPELRRSWVVEVGATVWHMVDLLWVMIFALIYVVR